MSVSTTIPLDFYQEVTLARTSPCSWGQVRGLVGHNYPCFPATSRKGTFSAIMLAAWWLRKQCNAVIFDGRQPDLSGLIDMTKAEAKLWATARASGLAALLPLA
jgi:hypothetical protein